MVHAGEVLSAMGLARADNGAARGRGAEAVAPTARTRKFGLRQDEIIRTAVRLINLSGVRGMTIADVAAQLGIVPTAITYYFPSKDELVAACFSRSIDTFETLIAEAAGGQTPEDRLRRLVRTFFELRRQIALGTRDEIAVFDDLRAQNDPQLGDAYVAMFRRARSLLDTPTTSRKGRAALNARTHLILSQLFWAVVWLKRYSPDAYPRAAERMLDILENGLGVAGEAAAVSEPLQVDRARQGDAVRETFLHAATELINEQGYHGASAEKISARLNVTKGAFYHHIDAKDDLVAACFHRTVEIVQGAQRAAVDLGGAGWEQLRLSATALVDCQISGDVPLLRTSALNSVPARMKSGLMADFAQVSLTFGAMICDGIADGSVRPVDSFIAAEMITAMINAAAELEFWAQGLRQGGAVEVFVSPLLNAVGVSYEA